MRSDERRKLVRKLARRDGGMQCFYCVVPLELGDETLDHFIPLAAGGTWDTKNLRLACQPCNNRKSDLVPDGKRHPVPAPRPQRKSRQDKHLQKSKRVPCEECWNGRVLPQGNICSTCGVGALPPERSHLFRSRLGECNHTSPSWCMICLIYPELVSERMIA